MWFSTTVRKSSSIWTHPEYTRWQASAHLNQVLISPWTTSNHGMRRRSPMWNSSVFTDEDLFTLPTKGNSKYPIIEDLEIRKEGVLKQLQQPNCNKAGGPGTIHDWSECLNRCSQSNVAVGLEQGIYKVPHQRLALKLVSGEIHWGRFKPVLNNRCYEIARDPRLQCSCEWAFGF